MNRAARMKRWLRLHATGNRQRVRNWMNRRAIRRGKSPLPERLARPVRASAPVYRNRTNPATGRPHRDDRQVGRVRDRGLTTTAERRERAERERAGRSR